MLRYGIRLTAALAAYSALPAAACLLAANGWMGASVALIWIDLALLVALLVVFSTFPLPARPGTLRRMDYAAMAWLPHVAVTRLTEERLHGRVDQHRQGRLLMALLLLVCGPAAVAWIVVSARGGTSPVAWFALAGVTSGLFLMLSYYGLELRTARGQLGRGADIG